MVNENALHVRLLIIIKQSNKLPGNSITTSHIVGILLSQRRRGVIKWPAYGTRRRICLEAKQKHQKQIIF